MRAHDGSALWWGDADTPQPPQVVSPGAATPVAVAVSPMRPGTPRHRGVSGQWGPVRQAIGLLEPRVHESKRAHFSGGAVRGDSAGWLSSCRCFTSLASRFRHVWPSRPSVLVIRSVAGLRRRGEETAGSR